MNNSSRALEMATKKSFSRLSRGTEKRVYGAFVPNTTTRGRSVPLSFLAVPMRYAPSGCVSLESSSTTAYAPGCAPYTSWRASKATAPSRNLWTDTGAMA